MKGATAELYGTIAQADGTAFILGSTAYPGTVGEIDVSILAVYRPALVRDLVGKCTTRHRQVRT